MAGLVTGLAVATKYNGFVIALPLFAAHLYRARGRNLTVLVHRDALLGLAAIPLGFFVGAPFAAVNLPTVVDALRQEAQRYRPGEGGIAVAAGYLGYLAGPDGIGALPLALAGIGLAAAAVRRRIQDVLALTYVLAYFAFVSLEATRYVRNVLVLLPFLALFGADAILLAAKGITALLARPAQFAAPLAAVLSLFALVLPAFDIARTSALAATPTTRAAATAWAEAHLLPQARVFTEPDGIRLSKRFEEAEPAPLDAHPRAWYAARRFDYLISATQRGEEPPAWLTGGTIVQEFQPSETRWGPTVRIYQLPRRSGSINCRACRFHWSW
jgi:hypothetical protein